MEMQFSERLKSLKYSYAAPFDYESQSQFTERNLQTDALVLSVYEYALRNLPQNKKEFDKFVKFLNAAYVLGTFKRNTAQCDDLLNILIVYHKPNTLQEYSILLQYIWEIELCVPEDIVTRLISKVESWI